MSSDVGATPDAVVAELEQIPANDSSNPELCGPCELIDTADIITESDYGCTHDSMYYKEMLSKQKPLDDVAISKWLGSIVNTHFGLREAHNVDALVKTVQELAPNTNWVHVMENLDHEGFSIPDESAFHLLISIYSCACKEQFPLHAVCGSLWKNIDGQISFLKHAVLAPADKFTFSHCSKQLAFSDLSSLSPGNNAWYCLELLEVICQLAEVGDTVVVRLMLEYPLEHCPGLLLVGLGHVNTEHNLLQHEVLSRVFCTVLNDTAESNVVKHLWNTNPHLTLQGFRNAHSDPNCLLRIVELCQDLEILPAVLDFAPFPFKIKLAAAASRKFQSHVKKWLSEKSVVYKGSFLEECVNLLKEIVRSTSMEQLQAEVVSLYWGSFPLFIEVCQSHLGELVSSQILDENSTICFDTSCNKLEEQVKEMILKYLPQPGSPDIVKSIENQICMLRKDLQLSKDSITKEIRKYAEVKFEGWECPYTYVQPDHLEIYGPDIHVLKTLATANDKTLKDLRKGLLNKFPSDALLCQVNNIFGRNKAASKRAFLLISQYNDFLSRFDIETSWLDGAGKQMELFYDGLPSACSPVLAELESQICELSRRVPVFSKERPQNLYSDCEALDALAILWLDIDMLSNKLISFTKTSEDLCRTSKNQGAVWIEKYMNATRFFRTERNLQENSSKLCEELRDLKLEVEQAKLSYDKKMDGLPEVRDKNVKYERIVVDMAWSWRTRLLLGRYILGEMRNQGLDMCAFVSTIVMTESLKKRESARRLVSASRRVRPKEFDIKLSEHHLQDTVRDFCLKNVRKGREKMDVCMERMIETGVVSEDAYNRPDAEATGFRRYHISSFKKMKPDKTQEAFHKLDDAKVLVGIFGITKGYFSLKPGDVYHAPLDSAFETNAAGNKLTHAVVIVGYGVSPEGESYYAFQNSYGPDWGNGGFGMVTCRSIQQLYSAEV